MISTAKANTKSKSNVEFYYNLSILNMKSDLMIAYYTLQFVKPTSSNMFSKIYETLNWGGAFIFSKKCAHQTLGFKIL